MAPKAPCVLLEGSDHEQDVDGLANASATVSDRLMDR